MAHFMEEQGWFSLLITMTLSLLMSINIWSKKRLELKFLEMIKQKYSADYKIISLAYNKKMDELEGVNNG